MALIENILNLIEEHKTELKDSEYKTALEDLSKIKNIISNKTKSYYSIKALIVSTTLNKIGDTVYTIDPQTKLVKYIYELTEETYKEVQKQIKYYSKVEGEPGPQYLRIRNDNLELELLNRNIFSDYINMKNCYNFRVYAEGDNRNPSHVKLHKNVTKYIISIELCDPNYDSDNDFDDDSDDEN